MTNWALYHYKQEFTLIEAAFLWAEIEPTISQVKDLPLLKEDPFFCSEVPDSELADLPPAVLALRDSLANEIQFEQSQASLKSLREKRLNKPDLTPNQAIDECIRDLRVLRIDTQLMLGLVTAEQNKTERQQLLIQPISDGERRIFMCGADRKTISIPRYRLLEIAEKWGVKPKFLYPIELNGTLMNNSENKPLTTKRRGTYEKLIRALEKHTGKQAEVNSEPEDSRRHYLLKIRCLLQTAKIDFGERGTAKQVVSIITRSSETLRDDAIRGVFDELKKLSNE